MRILKSHPLLRLVNSYLIDASEPSNISYLWNFGSLLAVCLIIQIVTGVTLAMHYSPNVLEAFNSIEHIMRDVNNGWLVRYLHSNTASAFFFLVYLHIGRGIYYGSYRSPRTLVWAIGTVILILMDATAFLGYVLPYGQMSLWGATVITNLISAIPWIGQDIVEFIWGGFSVNNATLNRFFALHFVLPFVLAALALMHLIVLHDNAGSSNPLGVSGTYDRIPFAPYFLFKDLITIFMFIFVLSIFVFFMPNVLGDSENYIMANPMQTPPAIVPEWYLLPFYAILRSIPNKLLGVIAMFAALVAILLLPITDLGRSKGLQFRPLSKVAFYIFVGNFFMLMQLGAKHVESPFIEVGQLSTGLYFAYFVFIMPFVSLIENTLTDLSFRVGEQTTTKNGRKSQFIPLVMPQVVRVPEHLLPVIDDPNPPCAARRIPGVAYRYFPERKTWMVWDPDIGRHTARDPDPQLNWPRRVWNYNCVPAPPLPGREPGDIPGFYTPEQLRRVLIERGQQHLIPVLLPDRGLITNSTGSAPPQTTGENTPRVSAFIQFVLN